MAAGAGAMERQPVLVISSETSAREQADDLRVCSSLSGDLAWIEPLIERRLKRITEPYQAD